MLCTRKEYFAAEISIEDFPSSASALATMAAR
jgi:hypothetical protein